MKKWLVGIVVKNGSSVFHLNSIGRSGIHLYSLQDGAFVYSKIRFDFKCEFGLWVAIRIQQQIDNLEAQKKSF
jgi:hypothetical protein